MNTIIKTFNGKTESDLSNGGMKIFIYWEQIMPEIEKAVLLRPDEVINGISVDEKLFTVSVGRKPGRKVSAKESEE